MMPGTASRGANHDRMPDSITSFSGEAADSVRLSPGSPG